MLTVLLPQLKLESSSYQEWMQLSDKKYEDNTLRAVAEDCFDALSFALGKQVVLPVLMEALK